MTARDSRMWPRALLAVLCGVLSATGCMPARFTGYAPRGPGVLEEDGVCVIGIADRLRLQAPGGVDIFLRATPERQSLLLDVYLQVPRNTNVRLLSDELLVQSPEWDGSRILRIEGIAATGPGELEVLADLYGAEGAEGIFALWFQPITPGGLWRTDLPAPRALTVSLPSLLIDGEVFRPAPVDFERYTKWGAYTCIQ